MTLRRFFCCNVKLLGPVIDLATTEKLLKSYYSDGVQDDDWRHRASAKCNRAYVRSLSGKWRIWADKLASLAHDPNCEGAIINLLYDKFFVIFFRTLNLLSCLLSGISTRGLKVTARLMGLKDKSSPTLDVGSWSIKCPRKLADIL